MKTLMPLADSLGSDVSARGGGGHNPKARVLPPLLRRIVLETLILSLSACVPALALFSYRQHTSDVPAVAKGASKFAQDALWIDARSTAEFEKGHIPGALSLNEKNWEDALPQLFETWQPPRLIVVYCSAGCPASAKIAAKLTELGIDPVQVMEGGFEEWKRSNG
jgi:rhodanese-related sulfurtransferase